MAENKSLENYVLKKREETEMTEFLSASKLKLGQQGEMEVLSYEGLNAFDRPELKVKVDDKEYLFSVNKTNEDILADSFKEIQELVGKKLKFVVIATQKGNSIQVLS